MRAGLVFLDYMMHVIHLGLMLICIVGWMFEPTRLVHLTAVILIAFSWLVLGQFFGYRYCLLTDTQWRIKQKLGQTPHTDSYVKYVLDTVTGRRINQKITDHLTLYTYLGVAMFSLIVNFLL